MMNQMVLIWNNQLSLLEDNLQEYVDKVAQDLYSQCAADTQVQRMDTDLDMVKTTITNVVNQINQLPLSQGQGGSSRQPKIGEPPEFNGTDGKVKFNEWLNKISLWLVHENVATDRQRIAVAMNRLSGAAAQYMEPWIKKLTKGQTTGTWEEFENKLKVQYGQRDDKTIMEASDKPPQGTIVVRRASDTPMNQWSMAVSSKFVSQRARTNVNVYICWEYSTSSSNLVLAAYYVP
ncbi:hypothetical protein BC835DRAFT_1418713 [Cytidiella melzeri]|nr:hypothetical protein BC835DRAFT_1418713 [Cytidiella melzeri]